MLRRTPTRIELKLDDITEFDPKPSVSEADKKQAEITPFTSKTSAQTTPVSPSRRRILISQRIGYNPRPVTEPSSQSGNTASGIMAHQGRE